MAGMPRAGTTFIYDALAAHPTCVRPYRKEVGYFSARHHRGEGWYRSLYRDGGPGPQQWVDISPDYFLDENAPERLAASPFEIRVVLAVREPAAWAVSFHRHISTFEWRVPSFVEFLSDYHLPDLRLFPSLGRAPRRFSIRRRLVSQRIESLRRALGPKLLVYDYEFFRREPLRTLRTLEQFWGLPPVWSAASLSALPINSSRRKHSRLMNHLLSRDLLVEGAGAVLPHGWIRRWRARRDQAAAAAGEPRPDDRFAGDLAFAREALQEDAHFVRDLFRSGPMLLGDGTPFPTA